MRFISTLAVAIILATGPSIYAQEPKAAPPAATLSADELAILKDSVEQLQKADADIQTARLFAEASQAKAERASLLLEARKLRLLSIRHLSAETHEVVFLAGPEGKPGQWLIRERPKETPKP